MLRLDPAVPADFGVLDLPLVEKRDQEGARDVQDVRRLLGRQHLADRHNGYGIALAYKPQHLHEEAGQSRRQRNFTRRLVVVQDIELGIVGRARGQYLAQLVRGRPLVVGGQALTELPGEGWHGHGPSPVGAILLTPIRNKRNE